MRVQPLLSSCLTLSLSIQNEVSVPRRRMFLDINCVDAARQRIRHVYDTFDTVCVQFSGGKDSTACLHLAKEVHEERGLGPVKVIFRDEEMLSPAIED